LVLALHLVTIGVLFGPRLFLGTTSEGSYSPRNGLGPSWWMQEQIADEIAKRATFELEGDDHTLLAVRSSPVYLLPQSLPRLFRMQHPDLDSKVEWVPEGDSACTVLVGRDDMQPNRLRLWDWGKTWSALDQPVRRAVSVHISGGAAFAGQISLNLDKNETVPVAIVNADGVQLPFWAEPESTATSSRRIWIKIPPISGDSARMFLYYGGPVAKAVISPSEVFDIYNDFTRVPTDWKSSGGSIWNVRDGVVAVKLPLASKDEIGSSWMLPDMARRNVVVEARIRYRKYPTCDDIGLIFAADNESNGYFAYLHGQGAVYLANIRDHNTVNTIGGNNWYWKPKTNRWFVFQVEWLAPRVRVLVDDREIIKAALVDAPATGHIGLGTRRGSGQPAIEIDWFRVRRDYADPPRVLLGPVQRLLPSL